MAHEQFAFWDGFYLTPKANIINVGRIDPYGETIVKFLSNSKGTKDVLVLQISSDIFKSIEFVSRLTPAGFLHRRQKIVLTGFDGQESEIEINVRKLRRPMGLEFEPWNSVYNDNRENLHSLVLDFDEALLGDIGQLSI